MPRCNVTTHFAPHAGKSPAQAALELLDLVPSLSMGQATAVDEVLGQLCGAEVKHGHAQLSLEVVHQLLMWVLLFLQNVLVLCVLSVLLLVGRAGACSCGDPC